MKELLTKYFMQCHRHCKVISTQKERFCIEKKANAFEHMTSLSFDTACTIYSCCRKLWQCDFHVWGFVCMVGGLSFSGLSKNLNILFLKSVHLFMNSAPNYFDFLVCKNLLFLPVRYIYMHICTCIYMHIIYVCVYVISDS